MYFLLGEPEQASGEADILKTGFYPTLRPVTAS